LADDVGGGTFAELIRGHRMAAGLSQRELANLAKISVRALRDLEHGRVRGPQARSVRGLADALRLGPQARSALLASVDPATGLGAAGTVTDRRGPSLRINVLGPLSVSVGGATVDVRPPMQRGLLGLLTLRHGQPVSYNEIVDVLWGEDPPRSSRNLVQVYVGRLGALLRAPRAPGRPIRWDGGGYLLEVAPDQVDLAEFDRMSDVADGLRTDGDVSGALDLLAKALDCWRGPVLADAGSSLRHHPAAVAAGQRRLTAAMDFADLALRIGCPDRAARYLRAVADAEPLHEGLHARLMAALASGGDQAAALQVYAGIRTRLADELGVDPGAAVQAAYLRLLRPAPPPKAPAPPGSGPPMATPPVPSQLPPAASHFTGRSRYLAELDQLAATCGRSSTVPIALVIGAAGVGKTALVAHWAHAAADRFRDGQLYVNLQAYAEMPPLRPIDALARLLTGLGLPAADTPVELADAAAMFRSLTAGRRLLVLLDDARTADQIRPLLPGQGPSMVLVTSRVQLDGLVARDGAHPLVVDELAPDESVTVLTRVLGERRVGAEPASVAELAQLCAHLPLALRVAAAKLLGSPSTSIADYVRVLRDTDRLAELAVADDPLASVRRALDLSYRTLTAPLRRLFRMLGLVPGPDIDVDAAAALIGSDPAEVGQQLASLARLHLLTRSMGGRFAWHDLLRLYARGRAEEEETADERAATLQRLIAHYLHRATAATALAYPHSVGSPRVAERDGTSPFADIHAAVAWLETERPNLVAAILVTADTVLAPLAWRLADGLLGYFWIHRHPTDWIATAEAALIAARHDDDVEGLAAAHHNLGNAYRGLARYRMAVEHLTTAVTYSRRLDSPARECAALGSLAKSCAEIGQLRHATALTNRAVQLSRTLNGTAAQAVQTGTRGVMRISLGELDGAADDLAATLKLHRADGSRVGEALALTNLGWVNTFRGRTREAHAQLTAGLTLHRQLNDRLSEALAAAGLGELDAVTGDGQVATGHATSAIELASAAGDRRTETIAYIVLAHAELVRDDASRALRHARTATDHAAEDSNRYLLAEAALTVADACLHLGDIDPAATQTERCLAVARQDGYRILEATALTLLAEIHLRRGQLPAAIATARQALTGHRRTGYRVREARTLLVLGTAHHAGSQREPARTCYDHARRIYHDVGARHTDARLRLARLNHPDAWAADGST
jgi:DNA-binding SARP family transcriptional activator/tetratricopeptide (TPR) repeat protein